MPSLSVFGAQWGDEGKGKIIDLLAARADYVVRYQGGANAGHTVVVGDQTYILHLVPSGVLHPGKVNVIGNGVAVDPLVLLEELDGLAERGVVVEPESLLISAGAHVIFGYHRQLDNLSEVWRGDGKIGTTGRGIGPCYADKASRTGLRIVDLLERERCAERLRAVLPQKNALFTRVHDAEALDTEEVIERYAALGERLRPFVGDVGAVLRRANSEGQRILFEGAQGTMLDLDHGTYPFVTSSSTGTGGIGPGTGFPTNRVERAIGVAKAYCTRVGEGPFPSEEPGEVGERIRAAGGEYGATTGRPRRCGWFDAVAMRTSLALNGADGWVMTNLDVLTGFEQVPVATAYRVGAQRYPEYPSHLASLEEVEVELESRPGWNEDISGARRYEDLPPVTRDYVEWVEERVGVPIVLLSVGPEREQVIPRGELF